MKRKIEKTELVFKIIAYTLLIVFSLMCVYPFLYAIGATFSAQSAVDKGQVWLLPVGENGNLGGQIYAFKYAVTRHMFWVNYSNTLFLALIGTIWCMVYTILGAYALSKKRLLGRHGFNFFLVFTMWFSAGIIPQYLNYQTTGTIMAQLLTGNKEAVMNDIDLKWLIVLAMGMNATNIILLRNAFEGVPSDIEEAARIDGATEFQILWQVYIPMSKATIATVALFFGISRWNGYFWAMRVMPDQPYSWPVQVYIRHFIDNWTGLVTNIPEGNKWENEMALSEGTYSALSATYAMVICAIIPILIIYPFIQKYFAKGVNMGGVKE